MAEAPGGGGGGGGGGHSGTEGGHTRVIYFAEEGVFLRPPHVRDFVKEGYFFVPRYEVWGSKSPYNTQVPPPPSGLRLDGKIIVCWPRLFLKVYHLLAEACWNGRQSLGNQL